MTRPAPAWAVRFLRDGRVARLGTVDRAGQPLALPVCFVFDGERCYVPIDGKPKQAAGRPLKRLRNIQENARVSLVVDLWDEDWTALRWVVVQGRAAVVNDVAERARAVALLVAKYPQYHALELVSRFEAVVGIEVTRLIAWSWPSGDR